MAKDNFVDFNNMHFWDVIFKFFQLGKDSATWTLSSENLKNFMKTKHHFDIIVVEICLTDYLIAFGRYFNAPVVGISAFGASKWTTDLVGTPNFPSYVPHTYNHYTDRMNFWQRVII